MEKKEISKIEYSSVNYKHFSTYDLYPSFVPYYIDRRGAFCMGGYKYCFCFHRIDTFNYLH